ncbi:hypothetical protein BDR06DRAFT_591079 [Suillus hirtellus]|nr:hypothetical protein BDR06DRAFT_591079 [Suillus hirtellus]
MIMLVVMENTKTVAESWCLRADDLLGKGSFGRVYKATRVGTGQIMAVKKSRASLALKTTVLDHERRVLQRLQGHPSIPRVFAYGRLEHFESSMDIQHSTWNKQESGSSNGLPCIGQIIDYARSLKFDQLPDYELLRLQIQETRALAGLLNPATINWNIPAEASSDSPSLPRICVDTIPLCPGQIVCCQIDVRITIEGYSARASVPLFWRDPSLP